MFRSDATVTLVTAARVNRARSGSDASIRDRAIDAAEAIVAGGGPAALNMRALADALEIGTATLYRHVGAKDDVLAALADRRFASLQLPEPGELEWDDEVRVIFGGLRRISLDHPELVEITGRQHVNGPAGFRAAEICLTALRRGGLDQQGAVNAFGTLSAYTFGFVQQELHSARRTAQFAERLVAISALPADEYPLLRESAATFLDRESERNFAQGLDLIIAGVTATPGGTP